MENKNQPPSTNITPLKKTDSSPLLGAGAVAGIAVGGQALKSKADSKENQHTKADKNIKKSNDKAPATTPKKSKTAVSKSKKSSSPTNSSAQTAIIDNQKTASVKSKVKKSASKAKEPPVLQKKQASKQDSSHASLAGSVLKPSSNSKPLQVAQASNRSGRCPSMPEIKSAVVFQSVKAPQIEPMNRQAHLPYNNYDLVMKKPAGVLVHLDGAGMDRNRKFAMDLFISGDDKYINKCFHTPLAGEMIRRRDSFCSFTHSHQIFKFFPLPMRSEILDREIKNLPIKLTLYPIGYKNDKKCHQEKIFKIKIIKTNFLKLGFTQIYGGKNCYASRNIRTGYDSVSYETVKAFARSREVKDNLEKMFPLTRVSSRILRSFGGNCDDTFVREWLNSYEYINQYTAGFLSDILALERARKLKKYHKLFAIVPQDYFFFHKQDDPANPEDDPLGLVIRPIWKECQRFWIFTIRKCELLGGGHNVVFIREDAINKGTVAHELAHTLGQRKEHYKLYYDEINKRHPVLCQRFRGSPLKPCEDYKIPIALEAGWNKDKKRSYWKFIGNRKSIMNAKEPQENIDDLWIDRETHQIIFKTLSEGPIIVPDGVDVPSPEYKSQAFPSPQSKKKQLSLKVIVSGFYYKKRERFVVPSQKIYKTDWLSPSLSKTKNKKIPPVTFQLQEKNKILQEVRRPVFKMEAELFYKSKAPKTLPFEFSPLMAALNLPENSKNRQLRIIVLSPKGKVIYSAPVRIKQKSQTENVAFIDKTQ